MANISKLGKPVKKISSSPKKVVIPTTTKTAVTLAAGKGVQKSSKSKVTVPNNSANRLSKRVNHRTLRNMKGL
jgi:hypothetical protein